MIIHNRTEFVEYLHQTIHDAFQYWGRYHYFDEHDNGPSELYNSEWYRRHVAWGPWLCAANSWAKVHDDSVHKRLVAFQKICSMYRMLFKDQEKFEDATFRMKVRDAVSVLDAYLNGWKYAIQDQTIEEWALFHLTSRMSGDRSRIA